MNTTLDFSRLCREVYENRDRITGFYHDLHRFPEPSLEEFRTTDYIMQKLREMSIESYRLDDTGCIALIGDPGERITIALRADIDGLPVREETDLPFASENTGMMHACGHDGHVSGLLGAAMILKSVEKMLPVRVKLIFQASEENAEGAKRLVDLHVLDDVDCIFGLHLFSDMPTGLVSLDAGERMAQTDRFAITFTGRGGHAAKPHLCIDATLMASSFVVDLQSLVSREINPVSGAVATVGSLHSGTQYNVISDKAVLEGTCRCYTDEISGILEEGIRRRAEAAALSAGGRADVSYTSACHPPVVNDPDFSSRILAVSRERIPGKDYSRTPPLMLGEDFSWYQKHVPGVFAFVGCGKPGDPVYPNHHPCFRIDEDALVTATMLHLCAVEAAFDR